MSLRAAIESLLFATDQPLNVARFHEVLPHASRAEIQATLDELASEYDSTGRAFQVQRVAGGYQLATRPEFAEVVRRLFVGKRRVRLTKAALEALAIIAYKQPTTRPEVDAIRGVSSGGVLETLLERNLILIAGRSEGVGRPLLYGTTAEFLQYLGLNDLGDLPSLEELEAMLAEREAEMRREEDEEMRELAAAPAASLAPGASGAAAEPAATLDDKLRALELATLEQLDGELAQRGEAIADVSARLAAYREESQAGEQAGEPQQAAEQAEEPADEPPGLRPEADPPGGPG